MNVKSSINWSFNFEEFHGILCNTLHPPLEFIWNLHVYQILSLETYLLSLSESTFTEFKLGMCKLCLMNSEEDSSYQFVQTGMLSYFVRNAFSNSNEELKMISESIVNTVIQVILSQKKEDITDEGTRALCSLWRSGTIEKSSLHKFCISALNQFTKISSITVMEAYSVQENCYNRDDPFHLYTVIEKIMQDLKPGDIDHLLFDVLFLDATNWKNFILLVDVFIRTHCEAYAIASKRIVELVKRSLQNSKESLFQKAILIERQAVLAMNPENVYPAAYKQWFLTQFGDCQQLKNPQTFNFFIQALTDLIPYEKNVEILKTGLERPFPVIGECQSVHADYIALLKTRINDLEPRVQPEVVIGRLLSAYEEAGRIPSYVLEASLMRKHYFLNDFLPVLLTPRVIPAVTDMREKFIEELDKAGKIPSQMLQKYKTACLQEKQNACRNEYGK